VEVEVCVVGCEEMVGVRVKIGGLVRKCYKNNFFFCNLGPKSSQDLSSLEPEKQKKLGPKLKYYSMLRRFSVWKYFQASILSIWGNAIIYRIQMIAKN
jgi:hypothetical protein